MKKAVYLALLFGVDHAHSLRRQALVQSSAALIPDTRLGYSMAQAEVMSQSGVRLEAEINAEIYAEQDRINHLKEQALVTREAEAIVAIQEEDSDSSDTEDKADR